MSLYSNLGDDPIGREIDCIALEIGPGDDPWIVNSLALRLDADATPTLSAWIAQVNTRLREAQAHEDVPFERERRRHGVRDLDSGSSSRG